MAPTILPVDPAAPDPEALSRAAAVLRSGGLVAFPTETVYGLGADARNAGAVERVFAAKGRPADNPLIVHVASLDGLRAMASGNPRLALELAARWWPGPLTVVVDADPSVPAVTRGGLGTVAVRMPDHEVARGLIERAGIPLAAPSANRSGRPSPTTAAHVAHDLGDAVDLILDGGHCSVGVESTVVDARGSLPVVLREGSVTREDLGLAAEPPGERPAVEASPGTRYRHYAPRCRVELAPPGEACRRAAWLADRGTAVGLVATRDGGPGVTTLAVFADAGELAARLYEALRAAEDAGVEVLVVEAVPDTGIGRAVMDRLRRAAASAK